MRRTVEGLRIEPAEALPQFGFKRQTLKTANGSPEKASLSVNTAPSAPSPPDSQRSPVVDAGREPVLAAGIALLVLLGIVLTVGAIGYETLNLGSTSAGVNQPVGQGEGAGPTETTAYIDSLDMEVSEDGPPFLLTATLHIGSDPAILPDGEVVVVARIVGPGDIEFDVEAVADERGNALIEQRVEEPGLYTMSIVEIRGEGLTYDPAQNDDELASVRVGDDDGPRAEERTVEQAESESEAVVETHTSSSEIDAGVATPEEDDGDGEEAVNDDAFSDANDELFGDGDDEPEPTPTPDDDPISPFPQQPPPGN